MSRAESVEKATKDFEDNCRMAMAGEGGQDMTIEEVIEANVSNALEAFSETQKSFRGGFHEWMELRRLVIRLATDFYERGLKERR